MKEHAVDEQMSQVARSVLEVIRRYSSLASMVLRTECTRAGLDPKVLSGGDLDSLIPLVVDAVARYTTEKKTESLRLELGALSRNESQGKVKLPTGVSICSFSRQVLEVLAEHTPFAWPIFSTQCASLGADPTQVSSSDLEELIPLLAKAVARWSNPLKEAAITARLRRLSSEL